MTHILCRLFVLAFSLTDVFAANVSFETDERNRKDVEDDGSNQIDAGNRKAHE